MPYSLKNAQHVMIDLETLALHEEAVVFSIGIVIYDGKWNELKTFEVNLDIEEQVEIYFRDTDKSTIDWWKKQDQTIYDRCTKNALSLQTGMEMMVDFLHNELKDPKKSFYWGNSAIFDLLKINSLLMDVQSNCIGLTEQLRNFKIDEYWMRCYKTTRDMFRDYFGIKHPNKNVTHYPIDDARTQGDLMRFITSKNTIASYKPKTVTPYGEQPHMRDKRIQEQVNRDLEYEKNRTRVL